MSFIGFYTLLRKEIDRFFIVMHSTLTPAIISAVLYILIFGYSIGKELKSIDGVSYLEFIVPGLVMMQIIGSAYSNTSSSLFMARRFQHIKDVLASPLSYFEMVLAITLGGVIRGMIVGILILIVALFLVKFSIINIFLILYYFIMVNFIFSSFGIIVGLLAEEFEHMNLFTTYLITPFTFLGGVFYSIEMLPEFFQKLSLFNPILYMVDGLRYGMLGIHDTNLIFSFFLVLILAIVLFLITVYMFNKGWKLRT